MASAGRHDLIVARAEQNLELAATYHELAADADAANASPLTAPGMLNQAVQRYHNALQEISDESSAQRWAAADAGLPPPT